MQGVRVDQAVELFPNSEAALVISIHVRPQDLGFPALHDKHISTLNNRDLILILLGVLRYNLPMARDHVLTHSGLSLGTVRVPGKLTNQQRRNFRKGRHFHAEPLRRNRGR